MSRESMNVKARCYLVDGRLSIEHADAETVRASVRGSDAVYLVGYCGGVWACKAAEEASLRRGLRSANRTALTDVHPPDARQRRRPLQGGGVVRAYRPRIP